MVKRRPAVLLLLLALAACSSNNQSRKAIAIVDVMVVDVQRGTGLPHMDVVVDGERITSVGPAAGQVPNGASVISGKGRFLIPGLWDMHIHVADDPRALGLLLAAGITGARDMASVPQKALDARRRIQEGALDGPRLLVAGPGLEGPPAEADYNTWIVHGPEEARKTVAKLVDLGVDFIKAHDHLSRETYHAVADSAKAKGIPFAGHVSGYVTPVEASDIGQKSIEHFEFLPKPCLALFNPKRPTTPRVAITRRWIP
jgi:imidazolonepropionase-like amidohydrolase